MRTSTNVLRKTLAMIAIGAAGSLLILENSKERPPGSIEGLPRTPNMERAAWIEANKEEIASLLGLVAALAPLALIAIPKK